MYVFPKEAAGSMVLQDCNMCRWCYFSSHFRLGLKGSGVIVILASVAWHILKWPLALSLGVLTLSLSPALLLKLIAICCSFDAPPQTSCDSSHGLPHSSCPSCPSLSPLHPPCLSPLCSPSPLFILSSPLYLLPLLPEDTHVLSGP